MTKFYPQYQKSVGISIEQQSEKHKVHVGVFFLTDDVVLLFTVCCICTLVPLVHVHVQSCWSLQGTRYYM